LDRRRKIRSPPVGRGGANGAPGVLGGGLTEQETGSSVTRRL
jgi:hypothetical protein